MKNEKSLVTPIVKWHKKLSTLDKRILWTFFGIIIIALLISATLETIRNYDSDFSKYECENLIKKELALSKADSFWQILIAENQQFLFLLGFGIMLGWIIHGVGFKVIGN